VPANSTILLKRARSLLDEGDIAGARLILQHLAERGEADAAYELARTYDRDALKALGARGVGADRAIAHRWYAQASLYGNAKAAERLEILASLSVSGPSD
jgi:TPR repeat protein